jgi:acyl-CoA thioesterase FadM
MNPIYQFDIHVTADVVDRNSHVNNVAYIQWLQDAAMGHARTSGCTAATTAVGAIWVVRTHHIEYLAPAFAGDTLTMQTWVVNFKKSPLTAKIQNHPRQRPDHRGAGGDRLGVFERQDRPFHGHPRRGRVLKLFDLPDKPRYFRFRESKLKPAACERAADQRGSRVLIRSKNLTNPLPIRRWVFCFNLTAGRQ